MIWYVIITAIFGVTSFVVFFAFNGTRDALQPRKILLSSLLFVLLIGACGLLGLVPDAEANTSWLVGLQAIYLLYGIAFQILLHWEFFGKLNKPGLSSAFLLVANGTLGAVVFTLTYEHFSPGGLSVYYSLAVLCFAIPFLFMATFRIFASIPPPIYKLWFYQPDSDEPNFDDIDLNNIYLLELEFSKQHDDPSLKNYKARAPIDMVFGEWFGSFVKNYNYKFEEEPIEYMDKSTKRAYGWIFFTKPKSTWATKKYIDPDLTIKSNRLTEKTIIGARRVEVMI
jgi:hypothetical protein